jgi:hypothetical protein
MSNDATPGFDPRFDPAFQRGFDGPTRTDVPASAPLSAPASAPRSRAPKLEKVEEPPEFSDQAEAFSTGEVDDALGAPTRRPNPFLIALTIFSIVLIVGGLWAAQFARESFLTVNLSTDIDYVTLQMVIFGAPLAVAIGIATALGVLFILAQRWRRSR